MLWELVQVSIRVSLIRAVRTTSEKSYRILVL